MVASKKGHEQWREGAREEGGWERREKRRKEKGEQEREVDRKKSQEQSEVGWKEGSKVRKDERKG